MAVSCLTPGRYSAQRGLFGHANQYAIIFLEIGTAKGDVHFLMQSIPTYSPTKILIIKSITAHKVLKKVPAFENQ